MQKQQFELEDLYNLSYVHSNSIADFSFTVSFITKYDTNERYLFIIPCIFRYNIRYLIKRYANLDVDFCQIN